MNIEKCSCDVIKIVSGINWQEHYRTTWKRFVNLIKVQINTTLKQSMK